MKKGASVYVTGSDQEGRRSEVEQCKLQLDQTIKRHQQQEATHKARIVWDRGLTVKPYSRVFVCFFFIVCALFRRTEHS